MTPALDAGGVEQATIDMARAVSRLGCPSLVASRGGVLEPELADAGGELVRLPVHARDPFSLVRNAGRLARTVRERNVSLIHVRSRAPAFSALIASKRTRAPMVATYHGVYSARSGLKRWYNSIMTRGDIVIANSAYTRDHILSEHKVDPARIALVPEAIDTDYFDTAAVSAGRVAAVRASWGLAPDERRIIILIAARMTSWKGHTVIARAFEAAALHDRAVLIMAGANDGSALEQTLAALSPRARRVDRCTDMPAAFLAADLVVAPSTQAESFGRTVVEAGAMGRPVLASALGAHSETVVDGETGWLATAGDVGAWASALENAVSSAPEARMGMGAAARARALDLYSLPAMYSATFAVYRRALETAK